MNLVPALTACAVLLLALLIDRWMGEPPLRLHPVVWMGKALAVIGKIAVRQPPADAFLVGSIGWLAGAGFVGTIAWAVERMVLSMSNVCLANPGPGCAVQSLAGVLVAAWLLKAMLSWRMLAAETRAVEVSLQFSLAAGRERLSWLVSRETAQLSESEVRESAIESLAENLNDSVIAPIFWFVLLGLPGAAVYRFANTADAMWGYKGLRHGVDWEWAGKWAARADDVLSWVPARITALLMAATNGGLSLSRLRAEARKTPSPNSGWPMAAMALLMGVRLGKPGVYVLNPAGQSPVALQSALAEKIASKALVAQVFIGQLAIICIAIA